MTTKQMKVNEKEFMEEWNFENWGVKYWSKTKEFLDYVNK